MSAIRVGYKQTELGVIPEDWICTSVGQLVQSDILEKPLDGNHGNIHPKSGDFVDFGIPFVMANNVQGGRLDLYNCSFIRKEQADSLQKGFSRSGDVLLTHKATIGNTAVVGEIPFPYVMLTPQVTYYRVKDRERLSNVYLRHFFDSASFQKTLQLMSGGGTRSYIGITAQLQLPVVVPPTVAEQEAVAEALSDADALIESLEQLLAKKRHLKQGAVQELLKPKAGWIYERLEDVADVIDPHPSHRAPPEAANGIPFVGIGDLNEDGEIVGRKLRYVSAVVFDEHRSRYRVEDNLIGLGRVASIGKVVRLKDVGGKYAISPTLGVIRGTKVSREYLLHALKSQFVTDQFTRIMSGSTRSSVGMVVLRRLVVPLPATETEQTSIAAVLSEMDAELAELGGLLDKTRALKQGMMQKLLTGEIRLI